MSLIPTIVFGETMNETVFGETINETVFGETKMLVLFIVFIETII